MLGGDRRHGRKSVRHARTGAHPGQRGAWREITSVPALKRGVAGFAAALMAPAALPAQEGLSLIPPSGIEVRFHERIRDEAAEGNVVRFRFVAPDFTGSEAFEVLMKDLEFLCSAFALPRLAHEDPMPDRVIISLADKPSQFGVFDPDTAQVFEAYSVEDGSCIWEMF